MSPKSSKSSPPIPIGRWAIRLRAADAPVLSALRLLPGISIHESQDDLWAKGDSLTESLDLELRKLPAERFSITENEKLLKHGKRIPQGALPAGDWRPIADWISPQIPPAARPAAVPPKLQLKWQPSTDAQEPRVLVTSLATLVRWATRAPDIRLHPLRFAMSRSGIVVVHGNPLPPVAGKRLVENHGVAWPCGMCPNPAIDALSISQLLHLDPNDLAIMDPDGSWRHIRAQDFVPLSRRAVRSSVPEAIA